METQSTQGKKKWFNTGYEGWKTEEQRLATLYGPNRVWLKPGGTADLVFVDNAPTTLHEHNPRINGDWKNWLTCLSGFYDPVCCERLGAKSKYFTGYWTVVDCSKWTDKKGNTHQYELKYFAGKHKTVKRFDVRSQTKPIAGILWRATRLDEKSENVGDEFEQIREVDSDKLFEVVNFKGKLLKDMYAKANGGDTEALRWLAHYFQVQKDEAGKLLPKLVPFNYEVLLAPKSPTEMRSLLAGVTDETSNDSETKGSNSGADEDIPF